MSLCAQVNRRHYSLSLVRYTVSSTVNAVIRYLFWVSFLPPFRLFSFFFSLPSSPFPLFFSPAVSDPQIQLRDMLALHSEGERHLQPTDTLPAL